MLQHKLRNLKHFQMIGLVCIIALGLISIVGSGGGGGGGGGAAPPAGGSTTPAIQVSPSSFDYGTVTLNNPAALGFTIRNIGGATLSVTSISVGNANFNLDMTGGSNPCNSLSPSIGAGGSCTGDVFFQPGAPGIFSTNLTINSNASNAPALNVPLDGEGVVVSAITVRINQVETIGGCPAAPIVDAYVSVTDQENYPVSGLVANNFTLTEDGGPSIAKTLDTGSSTPISLSIVMDYSLTISSEEKDAMENAVIDFVKQLGALDNAQLIKFMGAANSSIADQISIRQDFTSVPTDLIDAVNDGWTSGGDQTWLHSAVWFAVDELADPLNPINTRKAVIVITDGENNISAPAIDNINAVIAHAQNNGVPVFTIGVAPAPADQTDLENLADDTGGQYFDAPDTYFLRNIYQQLADVFFAYQYRLRYTSGLANPDTGNLRIDAQYPPTGATGFDIKSITPCP